LYHGIKNKRGLGKIRVSGQIENDYYILLTVEDNGIGISSERLQHIRESLTLPMESSSSEQIDEENESGFGLFNVHKRLRIYFGQVYSLMLEKIYSEGSRFSVRITRK